MIQGPTPLPPGPPVIPFDPNQLIPLVGMIGALVVGGVVLYAFFKSDLAKAMAERIRSHIRYRMPVDGTTDPGQVAELDERIEHMQGQIAELAERLDFAERLLAQRRERSLPGA